MYMDFLLTFLFLILADSIYAILNRVKKNRVE